ncbi:MAG: hypothetical protein WBB37_00170 [bacterium]
MLYFLIALSLGFEGGYKMPAVGFNDLNSGITFSLYVNRHFQIADLSLGAGMSYYTVENSAYALYFYDLDIGFAKNNWLFSPVIEFGPEYTQRKHGDSNETGTAFYYSLGVLVNFYLEDLRFYPKFYYKGTTDGQTHAGFIGAKLGVGYDF